MHFNLIASIALAGACAAKPIEMLRERAANLATTTSTFMAAYPYTASVCKVSPAPTPSAVFHCNSQGYLQKPSILLDDLYTASYTDCADICQEAQKCISFGFNSSTSLCTLYDRPLTDMGLIIQKTSKVEFANRHCFECAGTTTVAFTVKPSTTSSVHSTMTSSAHPTTTGKVTTTAKGTASKTSATPTTTFTAGPINVVSGGNFTTKDLGGFQASVSGATGSFTQLGDHYAYCCTAQLLGVDSVCVLSQNLNTPFGTQYNVGFDYEFINKLPGLSTITAPFSLGVIQEVLGLSSKYQHFSGSYFSLTDPSLFAIALNVPIGGNAVCITNITLSPV